MIILQQLKEPNAPWVEITQEECLELTEGCGYWKKGTVLNMLEEGHTVFTAFSLFKKDNKKGG